MDADSKPNPYDLDSDGDGISDVQEAQLLDGDWNGRVDGAVNSNGRNILLALQMSLVLPDGDAAGRADPYDIDADNDGIPDNVEGLTTLGYLLPAATDTDADGIDDRYDNYSGFGGDGIHPVDTDGDTLPDYLDNDTDGDGLIDIIEGNDLNLNGMADDLVTLTGLDTDADGLDNRFDNNNSNAEATSAYMGDGGTTSGDPTPGSITTVQHTIVAFGCATERDWRCIPYLLNCTYSRFRAVADGQNVLLDWTVQCSQEPDLFIIERSADQESYEELQQVKARPGVHENELYQAVDRPGSQGQYMLYYRLRTVMKSGNIKYSPVVPVRLSDTDNRDLVVFPNPVKEKLFMTVQCLINTAAVVEVSDLNGRVQFRTHYVLSKGNNTLALPQAVNLPSGMYILRVQFKDELLTRKFNKLN